MQLKSVLIDNHYENQTELFDLLEKVSYLNFLQGVMTKVFAMRDYTEESLKTIHIFQNSSFIGSKHLSIYLH